MTASNDAFRRISPLLRTMRIALTVSETECVLMDDRVIVLRPDGTLAHRTVPLHPEFHEDGVEHVHSHFSPVVSADWVLAAVGKRANAIWSDMLTDEEKRAIDAEGRTLCGDQPMDLADDPTTKFVARIMRRILGYHQTAAKAASLCSIAVSRMLDPDITMAVRHVCGWGGHGAESLIRDWDRVDATGRQIGLKTRPLQVSSLARLLQIHVAREEGPDGAVGILDVMSATAQRRRREADAYVADDDMHELVHSVAFRHVDDLCEIADLAPSILRSAGVKPAFWRMVLRMRPSQVLALRPLLDTQWTERTSRILNALSLVGEDRLPPTLLREVCLKWSAPMCSVDVEIGIAIVQRAADGIAKRRRRQTLRDAVDRIGQVVDHIRDQIDRRHAEAEAMKPATTEPLEGLDWVSTFKRAAVVEAEKIAAVRSAIPHTRTWEHLVAASDVWHAEGILAMDEGDARSWPPLLAAPFETDGVVVTELTSAAALCQETRELKHCVGTGGYAGRCMTGSTRILSLQAVGLRSRSTMEIVLKDGSWRQAQHKGRANSKPKPALIAGVAGALRAVNRAQRELAATDAVTAVPDGDAANDDAPLSRAA